MAAREWALLNPGSGQTEALTIEDVVTSPMMLLSPSPARLLSCHKWRRRARRDLTRAGE